jgi:RNA-directed DNA polymerase
MHIRGFFDNASHEWVMKFIEHRVADRRMLRLIQKSLKAGVSEDSDVILVRYADDLVVGFESRAEAELFLKAFKERLAKFGLESMRRRRGRLSLGGSLL